MKYLTYAEYYKFGFKKLEDYRCFDSFLIRASYVLDHVTQNFYQHNDLETDYSWRRDGFKKALACQIEYFIAQDGVTSEALNAEPQSQSIGRVSITQRSGRGGEGKSSETPLLTPDALMFLEHTGLLNRGIG